uniref:LIM zinc-binding domain-containing protein n=1 Tax=Acrobeloides nanus TaxID=290746 RepID=A0A914E1A6_9BILA
MSDTEDPYAVSSDSEDEDKRKGPPPKINIEGRLVTDLNKFKETLIKDKEEVVKDEERLKEIEELKKIKAEETKKMKKDFEEGKHLDTEVKKGVESLEGVGKENLVNMKEMFEKAPTKEFTKEKDALEDLIRSETDKKRIRASFEPPKEDEPKDCALCSKIVYPVERLVANKKLYHVNCFRCAKCNKKLTPISYNIHEGVLYCKPHVLEVLHPDRTGSLEEDDDEPIVQDEDEEFAVVSKPKHLSSQVVRGNTQIHL